MTDERRRILDLLAQGKVTVDEAEKLLAAVSEAEPKAPAAQAPSEARYLRIAVQKAARDCRPEKRVAVRIPLSLVKSGMRLGAMIPGCGEAVTQHLKERGIDVNVAALDPEQLDALLKNMGELTVDVDEGKAQVRITCE